MPRQFERPQHEINIPGIIHLNAAHYSLNAA
jgi:hypothetical protein